MAKQVRQFLARGVKFLVEHLTDPITSAENDLNDGSKLVASEQRKERFGLFRVHLSIPVIDSQLFTEVVGTFGDVPVEFGVPFCLPPLQEFLNESTPGSQISDGILAEDTPGLDLVEVSFGLDQRDEPAVIADVSNRDIAGAVADGRLDYVNTDAYRVSMSLMQKQMFAFGADAPWLPDQEVWAGEIAALNWTQRDVHANPVVWEKIEKSCDPMKSFFLTIAIPELYEAPDGLEDRTYAAVSVNVQLVFRHKLVPRDTGAAIQNLPDWHSGAKLLRAPVLTGGAVPVGDDDLTADTTNPHGVQEMLRIMDSLFLNKLRGGYYADGHRNEVAEHLQDDAAYHVEVLPFFGNFGQTRRVIPGNAAGLPYVGLGTNFPTCHRHILPISYPMTVHHVFAVMNYSGPPTVTSTHPNVGDFINDIGVLIGSGLRADEYKYTQVAYRTFAANAKGPVTVDRIKARSGGLLSSDPTEPWDFEIIDVPLVQRIGLNGIGLRNTQGAPFYIGKSSTVTASRTAVGGVGAPADNASDINENFLEVRWRFKNEAGGGLAGMTATDSLVGYGGHWLILVGKKHLIPRGGLRT